MPLNQLTKAKIEAIRLKILVLATLDHPNPTHSQVALLDQNIFLLAREEFKIRVLESWKIKNKNNPITT